MVNMDNKPTRSLFLIFNHILTPDQIQDAEKSLGVNNIIEMPEALKYIWSQISPAPVSIKNILDPIKKWLASSAKPLDYVLIQGDFGASYLLIQFAFSHDLIPIYSTTARQAVESMQPDGRMKVEHLFKHQIFRRYGY